MKPIFTFFVFILLSSHVFTQPGFLDYSFGDSGKVITTIDYAYAYTSVIQPDGKILIGGFGQDGTSKGTMLARYNTDGSPDLSFGENGLRLYILGDTGYYIPTIHSLYLQPDGKIVAMGRNAQQNGMVGFAIMRFNADGTPDQNFGIGGMTVANVSSGGDIPNDIALLSDGRVVVAGDVYGNESYYYQNFVACFMPDGSLDKSFGYNGSVIIDLPKPTEINAVAVTPDDKIVLGGDYVLYFKNILLRYDKNGVPDSSFGKDGLAEMSFPERMNGRLNDINILKNGNIVIAGYISSGSAVGRFTANGFTDSSFGTNGYTYIPYKSGQSYANALAIQENGKIVTGGYYSDKGQSSFTVVRYNEAGTVDSSFGINGVQNTYFVGSDEAYSVNIQKDGKIVLVGTGQASGSPDYKTIAEIARYYGDESRKQILITKIRRWLQHHNGIVWDDIPGVKSYAVQRSADGVRWSTVYRSPIAVNRQSTVNYYNDASPLPGTNYYRLQITSIDGAVAYSNVIAINSEISTISLSPNPAKNVLHIEGLPTSAQTKIMVVDLSGNVACSLQLIANSSSYNLNIASLHAGNYVIKMDINGEVVSKQFVKE